MSRLRRLTEHQTIRTRKEIARTYYNQNTQYTEKERILKAAKEKKQITSKANPSE
jgi:predicted transcriptional regulator